MDKDLEQLAQDYLDLWEAYWPKLLTQGEGFKLLQQMLAAKEQS